MHDHNATIAVDSHVIPDTRVATSPSVVGSLLGRVTVAVTISH